MLDNASEKNFPNADRHTLTGETAENDTNSAGAAEAIAHVIDPPRFVAPSHGGVDILKLLTELEDLVENTPHGPMGMLFRFNEDKFHMTIMKIRANLPEEMKRAARVARDSERIVDEARDSAERVVADARNAALLEIERGKGEVQTLRVEAQAEAARRREAADQEARRIQQEANALAERIHAEARAQAEQRVADSEIVRLAQVRAQDIQTRAEQEALELRQGAESYARDLLLNLETVLGKAVVQVQRGRETLEHRS